MSSELKVLVLSCSLNPDSKSRRLARCAAQMLRKRGAEVDWMDLQELPLPLCAGAATRNHPGVAEARARVEGASAVLIAGPIYNYDLNAAAKNFIELTGRAWTEKVVGIAVSAGGLRSGMAPMLFASSLMLDFRCLVLPRFVYTARGGFSDDASPTEETEERLSVLVQDLVRVGEALRQPGR